VSGGVLDRVADQVGVAFVQSGEGTSQVDWDAGGDAGGHAKDAGFAVGAWQVPAVQGAGGGRPVHPGQVDGCPWSGTGVDEGGGEVAAAELEANAWLSAERRALRRPEPTPVAVGARSDVAYAQATRARTPRAEALRVAEVRP